MATDDDAALKAPLQPVPSPEGNGKDKEASERPRAVTSPERVDRPERAERPERADRTDSDRINERLTERIRQGTTPPPDGRDRDARDREARDREARDREARDREAREARDREARDIRDAGRDSRDARDPGRDSRDARDGRDVREDKLNETIRQRLEHLVPELVKKTFAAGMGAVFSTEEGIRKIAREVSLPDVVGYVASSADGAKDKVFEVVARETRDFLANLNLTEEIAKILTTLSFEIKTEIRFIPNSERLTGAEPDVKASVKLKRNDKAVGSDEDSGRDSRSRLRFWRRDDEQGDGRNSDDENDGHDK